ncbi:hypothetical protein ABWK31_18610, partial [Bacillus sp. JJ353]|uniref:hypothetical protein n=1 Tax=Bacillus sp. JJ353 TaxID=3122967 RepID=UPI0033939EFE
PYSVQKYSNDIKNDESVIDANDHHGIYLPGVYGSGRAMRNCVQIKCKQWQNREEMKGNIHLVQISISPILTG